MSKELEKFLIWQADWLAPIDDDWPDRRQYAEHVSPDAIKGDAWLDNATSYIWKVGVLAQWDSNKFDYARAFIGHERKPGRFEFVGMLYWDDGENDDIGRCLPRYLQCLESIHPVFSND